MPLPTSAAAGPETLDLACLRGWHVVGASAHLSYETLFLDLATKLAQRLLEILRVLDDYLQQPITSFSSSCPASVNRRNAEHRRAGDTPP